MQRAKQYLFDISYQFLSKSKQLRACGVLKQACEIPTIDKLDLGLQSEANVSQRVSNVQSNLALVNFSRNTKSLLLPGVYYRKVLTKTAIWVSFQYYIRQHFKCLLS